MRSFTIISIKNGSTKLKFSDGRYESNTPSGAAKKIFSKANQHTKSKARSLLITLRETTQNSHKKEYTYKVKKIANNKTIERNGNLIHYKFITKTISKN